MNVFITGDKHRNFYDLVRASTGAAVYNMFGKQCQLNEGDTVVLLGDSEINYVDEQININAVKRFVAEIPFNFFVIHGNHENRASNVKGYEEVNYCGGKALMQPNYPNIIFAIDGEVYELPDKDGNVLKCMAIGGAYSVDKYLRLSYGHKWWSDEQPSPEIKAKVEDKLNTLGRKIDVIFSHTCPKKFVPRELFLNNPAITRTVIDNSTEEWLDDIEDRLEYKRWYFGHFHGSKMNSKYRLLFNDFCRLGE